MFRLYNDSLRDLRGTYGKYFIVKFIYMLLTSFLYVPMIAYIFNRVLRAMGSSALLNSEVLRLALSYRGITGLTLILLVAFIAIFIEFGVLIIIAQKKYFDKEILVSEAFTTAIRKLPRAFGFGLLQFMFFLLFLVPFIDLRMASSFINDVNIPVFIRTRVVGYHIDLVLYVLALIIFIYLFLRWIFILHFVIIENKSALGAIRASLALTRKNSIRILLRLLFLNAAVFGIGLAIATSVSFIPLALEQYINLYFLENYLITFSSFLAFVIALLLTPVNIIFVTRLFYHLQIRTDVDISDNLHISQGRRLKNIERRAVGFFKRRKYLNSSILAIYLIGTFLLSYQISDEIIYIGRNIYVAGHRGDLHSAPENSISGIQSAIQKGVDFIEIDVQQTSDGVIVLNHDNTLRRVAGHPGRVMDLTYEELAQLEIGGRFQDLFAGEPIPTLEEALKESKGHVKMIVEIKPYGSAVSLAENVVAVIEELEMIEGCYIQSFDYRILQEVHRLNDQIKTGQILFAVAGDIESLNVDFYTVQQNMLTTTFVKKVRDMDRKIWVWTVNTDRDIKEVLKYDIDGIITDYPERVQSIIGHEY